MSCCCSVVSDILRSHGVKHTRLPCPSLSHKSLLKLMSLELVISSNHLILCHPLLFSPSLFPSVRIFSSERVSSLHQVAKVLEFQLQHQSFLWIFRVDFLKDWLVWFPCCPRDSQESSPAPRFKGINSSGSAFFIVQLSHPYMTIGEAIALTVWHLWAK